MTDAHALGVAPHGAPGGDPPIEIGAKDWANLIAVLREQVPGMEVWAFGSRARRCAKSYSDLDLAFIAAEPMPLALLADITNAFDNSDLSIRVDIVDWASASEAFRRIIAQDKALVQRPPNTPVL